MCLLTHASAFTSTSMSLSNLNQGKFSYSGNVVVVGGSGRVGGSTVRALKKYYGDKLRISVGGRSETHFRESRKRWQKLAPTETFDNVHFLSLDTDDKASIEKALEGCDLVIHTAGPFQRKSRSEVLEVAISGGIDYVDVCDDSKAADSAKLLAESANRKNKVSAVISAGIWPGIDQLMAVECCDLLGGKEKVHSIEFSAFTAGTGNAGTTILSATFLILAERVLCFKENVPLYHNPASDFKKVNFGEALGDKTVFRMNLIEARTCNEVLNIPNIDTFFGTAPEIWNHLLALVAVLPRKWLRNRNLMQSFAKFSEPIVRLTDKLVGSTNAMKVSAVSNDRETCQISYAHRDLEECVGIATAAFAASVLRGDVRHGVWFPEEAFGDSEKRKRVIDEAIQGNFLWDVQCS
eukprot:CAMPEP_0171451642 /NCGR_PEP_ID=MMETSP0945-20130129/67_1 /TAXON_ID=109269 /ORGANISM="Vaucheria litorea, Strain CCMP2940" /LENGTH=407 /DNA_ID=CAMNT_0011976147 /DNA_START=104 /DNA_END=1323 /DNA_ORIENTATION=+